MPSDTTFWYNNRIKLLDIVINSYSYDMLEILEDSKLDVFLSMVVLGLLNRND